jgi:hypothetical protein
VCPSCGLMVVGYALSDVLLLGRDADATELEEVL